MGRPLREIYFVVNLNPPKIKWASYFSACNPPTMCFFFATCCGQNDSNWKAWDMENLFNNKFNILLLIILKNTTNWYAARDFDSFSNAIDCDSGQMFISTWNKISFIKCCAIQGTIIGTNIEKVGVKLFLSNVSLEQDSNVSN